MTDGTFQLGQIWRRGRYHGLLLSADTVDLLRGDDTVYTVFLFERGITTEWYHSYMIHDIEYRQMELIA